MSKLVQSQGRDDDPPGRSESSAGSRSRRKAPAGRPTRPAIRLSGRGHWRGQIGPGGGVDGHGRRYRNFCKPTRKVRWLAFVHGQGDHDEARTAYRVGEGELIAAHHAAPASAGRAWQRQQFEVGAGRFLGRWCMPTHTSGKPVRGATFRPAWGGRGSYQKG